MSAGGRNGGTVDADVDVRPISNAEHAAAVLGRASELAEWPRQQVAHLVPYTSERHLTAGELLYRRGDEADYAFCLVQGRVRYGATGRTTETGFVGHEAALDEPRYLSDVAAETDVIALAIPREVLRSSGVAVGNDTLYHSLLTHYALPTGEEVTRAEERDADETTSLSRTKLVGWLLTLVVPLLLILFGERYGLSWQQRDFLAALSVCLLMMSFTLTPQYAAALIAGLAALLLDVAPANVILSGFASDGFFMGLSIFGLGAVLTSSGLAERLVLNILKRSPRSPFWYNVTILLTGVLMTPCLPSANTRVGLMTPLIMETSRSLGYRDGSREATRLMLSMFIGASLFAPVFLTAKSLNFVVYTQMPDQIRNEFQWLKWTLSASVAGFVMLALYLVLERIVFRRGQAPRLSLPHVMTQIRLLGPMRASEWQALVIATAFIVAIVTYSIHKISPAWITLAVLCVFLVLGTLDERHIRHDFQWDVLLLVGFFIGLENTLDYTGMTALLTTHLPAITQAMGSSVYLFIALVALITFALRLFLPITTTGVLVASVLLPLSEVNGLNPWIVGFVVIVLSETWFLPAQCSYFLTMEEASGERPVHDRRLFLQMSAVSMAIRLVALFASIPFFRYLGLL